MASWLVRMSWCQLGTRTPATTMLIRIVLCNSHIRYSDVITSAMTSQITSITIVYSAVFFRHRSRKTSKLRVTGLCEGNSPVTGEFPAQRASDAENVPCSTVCTTKDTKHRHNWSFSLWRKFTGDSSPQRGSYAERVSMFWRHHIIRI